MSRELFQTRSKMYSETSACKIRTWRMRTCLSVSSLGARLSPINLGALHSFIRSCSRDSARVGLVPIILGFFVLVREKFVALSNKRSSSSLISNDPYTRCAFVEGYWLIDWQSEIAKMTIITKAITEKKASNKMEQPLFVEENVTVSMLLSDERNARLIT